MMPAPVVNEDLSPEPVDEFDGAPNDLLPGQPPEWPRESLLSLLASGMVVLDIVLAGLVFGLLLNAILGWLDAPTGFWVYGLGVGLFAVLEIIGASKRTSGEIR